MSSLNTGRLRSSFVEAVRMPMAALACGDEYDGVEWTMDMCHMD